MRIRKSVLLIIYHKLFSLELPPYLNFPENLCTVNIKMLSEDKVTHFLIAVGEVIHISLVD